MPTKSQEQAADMSSGLRSRNHLFWVATKEESRVERHIFQAAASAGYVPHTWDVAQGAADMAGKPETRVANGQSNDPSAMLAEIANLSTTGSERGLWIMRDLPIWLQGPPGAAPMRQLRNLARSLTVAPNPQAIVVLSPSADIPAELSGHATVIDWPLPDKPEIADILDAAIAPYKNDSRIEQPTNGTREAAIDAALGLSGDEAQACYARSLVQFKRIDPTTVANEKKRLISRATGLEWIEHLPDGLNAVGGLDYFKQWLLSRSVAYSPKARAYGLPLPRGVVVVGVSGCGKSLLAKATATVLNVPLLRADLGAMQNKYVGDSQKAIRQSLKTVDAIGPSVLWVDEIEKQMAGATQGAADGGVSADQLGTLLQWAQERAGGAFIFATANDVSALPPEMLRKGRFDEIFFVDVPNAVERVEVLKAALRKHNRGDAPVDHKAVAAQCPEFTGAEIAELVPDALFTAFNDGAREIETRDLIAATRNIVPLTSTAKEKIARLRDWAKGRARYATAPETESDTPRLRVLDLS